MSDTAKEFENVARDCVKLAEDAATPELRNRLLGMAREWMQEENADVSLSAKPRRATSSAHRLPRFAVATAE